MKYMRLFILALTSVSTVFSAETKTINLQDAIRLSASVAAVDLTRLDAAIARAGLDFEKSFARPQVEAVAGWTRQRLYQQINNVPYALTPDNTVDARLRVGQALIDLELWNRVHAAARRLEAADAATAVSLEQAAAIAAEAYATLAQADALFAVRSQDLALAEELLQVAQAQVKAGVSEGIAVTRAETRVASARTALTAAIGQQQVGTITLARALRLDPGMPIKISDPLSTTLGQSQAATTADNAIATALQSRPELRVSTKLLAALRADYNVARSTRLPTVDAFADAGRIGPQVDDTETTWRLGLEIRIPLLNGQKYLADASHYRIEQQYIIIDELKQDIAAQVRAALIALETGQAGLASATEEQRLAEQELSEARKRFTAGVAGNLDVIDAQRSLAIARDRVVSALSIVVRARIELSRAVGVATTLQ